MVTKKNITEIFELILKTYDDEEKCKKEYETFNYTTMKGENVTIEVEELHQIPNFQEAVQKVVDDYISKGQEGKIWRLMRPIG